MFVEERLSGVLICTRSHCIIMLKKLVLFMAFCYPSLEYPPVPYELSYDQFHLSFLAVFLH